jgi:hypothetical protein
MLDILTVGTGAVIFYSQSLSTHNTPFFLGRDGYWARSKHVAMPFASVDAAERSVAFKQLLDEVGYNE